ncbi:MAG: 5-formyltetrahydrofolate cyclo-ligase [Microbacterium sp.]|uniref:5-formyltetrahydrofolate cyclo-ligase n=1 Tax=Microbacterium sp. TaxID=51671 RepID=UPI0039E4D546
MPAPVVPAKRALRAEIRARRTGLPASAREAAAAGIRAQLDEVVAQAGARVISCYLSSGTEPGTRAFVAGAVARGIRVLLPSSRPDGTLDWIAAGDEVTTGLFGLPEPVGIPVADAELAGLDLMVIPAAAVDRTGMRLGWGRGYFDRALAALPASPPVYAVVYDDEVLADVPTEPHDRPVTGVVTPTQTIVLQAAAR